MKTLPDKIDSTEGAKLFRTNLPTVSLIETKKKKSNKRLNKQIEDLENAKNVAKTHAGRQKTHQYQAKATNTASSHPVNLSKNISTASVISGHVVGNGSNTYTKSSKPKYHKRDTQGHSHHSKIQKSTQTEKNNTADTDTPRSDIISISTDYRSHSGDIRSHSSTSVSLSVSSTSSFEKSNKKGTSGEKKQRKSNTKQRSFAYYLPLYNNATPIQVGSRVLRHQGLEGNLNKENRNILSNYISSLNASAIDINPKKKSPKVTVDNLPAKPIIDPNKTLQEALNENLPSFIKKSQHRVEVLRQIKEERCLYSEMQRKMIENLVNEAPRNQIKGRFPITTAPKPKPRRLFNYKEMVRETRRKYESLPEVLYAKYENKRMSSYRTNRLMADIYQRRLKDNVLKGKVSIGYNRNILN